MKVDAIVVGMGLAGLAMVDHLQKRGKSVMVFDSRQKGASHRAAGVYNPTILKRYTMAWEGPALLKYAVSFYRKLELELEQKFLHPLSIARIFSSVAEQNMWTTAADKKQFSYFLNPSLHHTVPPSIKAPFGFGLVHHVGRLNIPKLLESYQEKLISSNSWRQEPFQYNRLVHNKQQLLYDGITAQHLIFCEGVSAWNNPFFKDLPLRGSHGDIIRIYAEGLDSSRIWKSGLFIVPQGENLFWVGASFNNHYKQNIPTDKGQEWLVQQLEGVINVPYEIQSSEACIRPTIGDRRPLLGTHPVYNRIHLLNGLGSRGVLTAPQMAAYLCRAIYDELPLPEAVNLERFSSLC